MNATLVKLAAAAVVAIAAVFGVTQLTKTHTEAATIAGPAVHTLPDGSTVNLAAGARNKCHCQRTRAGEFPSGCEVVVPVDADAAACGSHHDVAHRGEIAAHNP